MGLREESDGIFGIYFLIFFKIKFLLSFILIINVSFLRLLLYVRCMEERKKVWC